MKIRWEYKLQDLWVGVFWHKATFEKIEVVPKPRPAIPTRFWPVNITGGFFPMASVSGVTCEPEEPVTTEYTKWTETHVWICLIPCFPIHISWRNK